MTTHWIMKVDETTTLLPKVALVAFHCVCGSHDRKSLTKIILELLDRAKITVNVRFCLKLSFNYISDTIIRLDISL